MRQRAELEEWRELTGRLLCEHCVPTLEATGLVKVARERKAGLGERVHIVDVVPKVAVCLLEPQRTQGPEPGRSQPKPLASLVTEPLL